MVSIIINNYNYGRFLTEAIDSALQQNYSPIEVIVVDDGSIDNSSKIISNYGNRIVSIFQNNQGQVSAINTGFAASKGDIICFLDADDIFFKHKVTKIVPIFNSDSDIGWCFHSLRLVDLDTKTTFGKTRMFPNPNLVKVAKKYDLRQEIKRGKLSIYLPSTSGLCFKRSVLEQILPMPVTFIKTSGEYYLRPVAVLLSPGFILTEALCAQRIHGENAGTKIKHQRRKHARGIVIAYLLRINFPQIKKFTNRMFARNLINYWKNFTSIPEYQTFIKNYFALTSLKEKINIYLRAIYCSFPFRKMYTHQLSKIHSISLVKSNSFQNKQHRTDQNYDLRSADD